MIYGECDTLGTYVTRSHYASSCLLSFAWSRISIIIVYLLCKAASTETEIGIHKYYSYHIIGTQGPEKHSDHQPIKIIRLSMIFIF